MRIRYCESCKKYMMREKCAKCGKETLYKHYKFRFKWANREIIPEKEEPPE